MEMCGVIFDLDGVLCHTDHYHYLAWKANKYLAGRYRVGDHDLYVSRGAGYWGPPMRLLAPAEITEIILKPQKK